MVTMSTEKAVGRRKPDDDGQAPTSASASISTDNGGDRPRPSAAPAGGPSLTSLAQRREESPNQIVYKKVRSLQGKLFGKFRGERGQLSMFPGLRLKNSHAKKKKKITEKNGFVTATKLGTTNISFFVAATKNFAAATKRFVDRTKHYVVVTKYFCNPCFNK